jgi:hypothetical protein
MLKAMDRASPADHLSWLQKGSFVAHHNIMRSWPEQRNLKTDLFKEKTVIEQMIFKRMHVRDLAVVVHTAIAMLNHLSARTYLRYNDTVACRAAWD